MAPPLAAAGVVDGVEELGQGAHLCGGEHHLGDSMSQAGVEMGALERCPRVPAQGMDEHKLGPPMFAIAVAAALAAEAAGPPDLDPVRGAVDGAAEAGWVDERFQQQQSMAEPGGPVADQAARAQRQHPRAEVTGRAGQEQEAGVVGEQMQPVELHGEAPANPPVARGALQRRRREHHQRQPLAAMMGDVAQCLADSRQRTEVVVRLHQGPKPGLVMRRHQVDDYLRQSHQRCDASLFALVQVYQSAGGMSSPAVISLGGFRKPCSTNQPCMGQDSACR